MYKQSDKSIVPSYSIIKDYFQHGDTIVFDLTTQEYWLKCKFTITTSLNSYKTTVSLDVKVPIYLKIKKLKMMLIQFGIIFFCENIEQINEFHFAVNKVMIKLTSNLKSSSFNNLYMDNRVFENCKFLKSKFNIYILLMCSYNSVTVNDVFKFNSEISATVHLTVLEELLYEIVKSSSSISNYPLVFKNLTSNYYSYYNNKANLFYSLLFSRYCDKFGKLRVNIKIY
jgi:hypothetical protein